MKNNNTSKKSTLKNQFIRFYQCEVRAFKRILGIK